MCFVQKVFHTVGTVAVFVNQGDVRPMFHQPVHHGKIVRAGDQGDGGGGIREHHVQLVVTDIRLRFGDRRSRGSWPRSRCTGQAHFG